MRPCLQINLQLMRLWGLALHRDKRVRSNDWLSKRSWGLALQRRDKRLWISKRLAISRHSHREPPKPLSLNPMLSSIEPAGLKQQQMRQPKRQPKQQAQLNRTLSAGAPAPAAGDPAVLAPETIRAKEQVRQTPAGIALIEAYRAAVDRGDTEAANAAQAQLVAMIRKVKASQPAVGGAVPAG